MPNKVKFYREKLGLTQYQLAEKASVSRNTICLLETQNNFNVTYEVMNKVAEALGYTVPTIFFSK